MRQSFLLIPLLITPAALPPRVAAQVTVGVHNMSAATERDIADLKEAATAILEHAQVEIVWADCARTPGTCAAPPNVSNISLLVINEQGYTGCHAIGWTTLGTYVVTVHYRRAQKMSRASTLHLSSGRILGYTAAHEIGHLVLGSADHGEFGIMKANYDGRDLLAMVQGRLYFSGEDARKMRSRFRRGPASGHGGIDDKTNITEGGYTMAAGTTRQE